ncbi:MAG: PASTA domain-containing protein [Actinomycetaceae bacterium]|nr:PASTA domain-containing protein [Actinomycetaceae bacterium]
MANTTPPPQPDFHSMPAQGPVPPAQPPMAGVPGEIPQSPLPERPANVSQPPAPGIPDQPAAPGIPPQPPAPVGTPQIPPHIPQPGIPADIPYPPTPESTPQQPQLTSPAGPLQPPAPTLPTDPVEPSAPVDSPQAAVPGAIPGEPGLIPAPISPQPGNPSFAAPPSQQQPLTKKELKKQKRAQKKKDKAEERAAMSDDEKAAEKMRKWKRFRLVGYILLLVVALGGGTIGGWFINDALHIYAQSTQPDTKIVQVPISDVASGTQMPDLRGMTKDDALTALHDLGFATRHITVEDKQWAGESGLVVSQSPAPGTDDLSDMKLSVSVPAKVPDVIGKKKTDALTAVREIGAEAIIEEVFDSQAKTGTVLEILPKAGEILPGEVTLKIAASGASVYMSEVSTVSGSCGSGEVRLGGKPFPNSLHCSTSEEGYTIEWDLQKKVSGISATVGIADDERDTGGSVTVTVYADDKQVASTSASFGKSADLKASTEGALRLKILVTGKAADDDSWSTPNIVLGDARFIGTKDNIDAFQGVR